MVTWPYRTFLPNSLLFQIRPFQAGFCYTWLYQESGEKCTTLSLIYPDTVCVDRWAYLVATEEHEEVLRFYETENYEIVRCTIIMKDGSDAVRGLTFKFVGSPEHLA